jgi:hypothetical protein
MKKLLMIFALITGLMSCGGGDNTATAKSPEKDRVEVIYFHGKQRCATCMAIEKNAKEVVNTLFTNELENGTVVFKTVDISTPEGEKIADRYEVTWSSLFVNKWKGGKETRNNMTEFGFGNARKNPDGFKKGLADKIRQLLK